MKKLLFLVFLMVVFISCNNNQEISSTIDVEQITTSDQHYMISQFGENYNWIEQSIRLVNYLDESSIAEIESVANIFQTMEKGSYDVNIIYISHDTVDNVQKVKGFWIENYPLESINITFEQAFDRLMESNYPKPHSKNCVLRKKIGLINSNPQYVFGNMQQQLFVDAITGEVDYKNPIYGDFFGIPLRLLWI